MKALIVDDSPLSLKILKRSLEKNGTSVITSKNGEEFFKNLEEYGDEIGVITLDREMPDMTGEEIALKVKMNEKYRDIPIIFISSLSSKEDIEKGLEIGVYDYIPKPIDSYITFLKVSNAIRYYKAILGVKDREKNMIEMSKEAKRSYRKIDELNRRLREKNKILEVLVEARTKELQEMTHSLISALENANLYNDENTGQHIERVALYSEIIAREAGLEKAFVKEIKLYAPLHDIGKVGIRDAILKKPGKYNEVEFGEMKKHVSIGYNMIKDSPLSEVAKNIIRYHHEKWDGSGYGLGLKEEEIPREARIVTLADVFDALSTKRTYKEAFNLEKTLGIMTEGRGSHFDPFYFDIFIENIEKIVLIRDSLLD